MAKTKPNSSPCIYFNLRQATRLTGLVYDGFFRRIGLRGTQYSLLLAIERLGAPSIGCLSQALGLEQSTVTRNINLLVRKGLVQAHWAPDDTRRKALAITPAGREKIAEAGPVWQMAQESLIEKLGPGEAGQLLDIMERLVERLK